MKEGWTYKKLGECVEKTPKQKQVKSKDYKSKGKYPIVSQEKDIISGYWDDEDYLFRHKKPVIVFGDHTKEIKYIDFDFVVGADGTQILQPKDNIDAKFFYYALKATPLRTLGYARHFKLLKEKSFKIFPLSEQQRIVKQLDEAFAEIDTIKAAAEKQLSEAKSLFQKALSKAMTPKEGWEEKTLKEIGDTQTGNTPSKNDKSNYGDYIPFIRPAEINYDGLGNINYKSEMSLSEKGLENGRLFKSGSVFMVCIGATIGKVAISTQDVSCNQQINILTPNSNTNAKFAFYAMSSKAFNNKVLKEGMSAQATLPIISKGKWEKLSIPIPPLSEQQRIVEELDELAENVKEIEKLNDKLKAECDAMKQALLRQVFE